MSTVKRRNDTPLINIMKKEITNYLTIINDK